MKRREFLTGLSGGALAAGMTRSGAALAQARGTATAPRSAPGTSGPASAEQPNVLIIISDQHRAGLSKRAGYPFDTQPALDAMGARGIDFTHGYCTTPLCVPSRISMLTGRWPDAHRVRMNQDAQDAFYTKDLYDVAHEQGYRTALIGKNHTYLKPERLDVWREYGHERGYMPEAAPPGYAAYEKWLNGLGFNAATEPTPFPLEVQFPYRIVSETIDFMHRNAGQRFCLQVSFPEPHDPEQVPRPYWDMFPPDALPDRCAGPEALARMGYRENWLHELATDAFPDLEKDWRRYVSNYLGAARMIDDQMKRLFDFMAEAGLGKNTIVVVLSDHGEYLMEYGLARKGVGVPECLARIPMVWAGPGIRPDLTRASDSFVSMADVMPTLCEFMRAPIPIGVQGRSLKPMLCGEAYPADEFRSIYAGVGLGGLYYEKADHIPTTISRSRGNSWDELNKVTQSGNAKMVRMGDWKLVFDMMGYGQLYHLPSDPCELVNRYADPVAAEARQRLMAELLAWTIRTQDSLPTGPQNAKYQTKWPAAHNWYAPSRLAPIGSSYRP